MNTNKKNKKPDTDGSGMPANWRDALAISLAFLAICILIQFVATLFDALGFVHAKVQTYVLGLSAGLFVPLLTLFRGLVYRKRGQPGERTASPRSATIVGLIAGTLIFVATQAASLVAALVLLNSVASSHSAVATVATVVTAAAALFAGFRIHRRLDSRRFAALSIAALTWLVFSLLLGWVAGTARFVEVFRQASSSAGVLLGMLVYPVIILIAGGAGLWVAAQKGKRT